MRPIILAFDLLCIAAFTFFAVLVLGTTTTKQVRRRLAALVVACVVLAVGAEVVS